MSGNETFDTGRFARIGTLVAAVTAVFLLLAATRLEGRVFQVGAVAIGGVAVVTAMTGFLIAAGSAYEATQER